MLQIETMPYASDALEDAMRLAQTKALNSYSFSDCLNYLNYVWMDMYNALALIDEGYYSKTIKLTQRLTKLPPYVKNSIKVYAAQEPIGFNRRIYKSSGYADLQSAQTYHISGFDLYCPDAIRVNSVWLNYIPQQPMLFFTRNNRDPKIYTEYTRIRSDDYHMYKLQLENGRYILRHKQTSLNMADDITDILIGDNDWEIVYITCDFPYIFVSYKHKYSGEYRSGFFKNIQQDNAFIHYNPFAFTGRNSNVEYLSCKWNDKTGMGVVVIDHSDDNTIKEMGWTPDSLIVYPCPEMYRLLVARLAEKFSALNESNVMGVQNELTEAMYAFQVFCKKDKSSWQRIDNVQPSNPGDWL